LERLYRTFLEDQETGVLHPNSANLLTMLMLVEECKEWGSLSPEFLNGTPVTIHLYVESNVDEAFQKALAAGAKEIMPLGDMFWGDRYGVLKDPFGHSWSLATKVRDVTPEELKAGAAACGAAK
jgi:uncharacterized glyoxalase superfamily protein PhnB